MAMATGGLLLPILAQSAIRNARLSLSSISAVCCCSGFQRGLSNDRLFPRMRHRQYSSRPYIGQADSMMDIGTRPLFSEEHDMFRATARRFFQEEVAPNQDRYEKQRMVDKELWEKVGSAGLLGVDIPVEKGGVGGDILMAAILWEEQFYVNGAGPNLAIHSDVVMPYIVEYGTEEQIQKFIPAMGAGTKVGAIAMTEPSAGRFYVNGAGTAFAMHSDIVMPYIADYGTQEQIERFLPEMAAGRKVGALAMTEPAAGSDLQGITTYAKKDGDDYILNGSKVFITNGYLSDVVIVVAITDLTAQKKAHGIGLFLVEEGMPGFTKGKVLEKIGQKSVDCAELFFEDVRLPASALLGAENQGFYMLMNQLPRERLIVGVMCQAHCEFMFEETRNYVRQRKAFGKTLANIQTIQHKLADLKTQICVSRSFIDECLTLAAQGNLDTYTASMAKMWASDLANRVATECLQLHGGWGYMWEYPIARAFCDTRVNSIYAGSNEIMKELIYRPIVASN